MNWREFNTNSNEIAEFTVLYVNLMPALKGQT